MASWAGLRGIPSATFATPSMASCPASVSLLCSSVFFLSFNFLTFRRNTGIRAWDRELFHGSGIGFSGWADIRIRSFLLAPGCL